MTMIPMNSSPRYRNTPVGPPSGWREPVRFGANDDPRSDDFGTFTSCMLKYVSTNEHSMYCPSPVRSRWSRAKPIGIADQRGDARIGRAHVVEAGLSTERPGLPGQGNRAHDELRMNGAQFVI